MASHAKAVIPIVRTHITSHKVGVVVSAGKMDRAVKVRIAGQEWNKKFRKHFPSEKTHLVADPNNSLVEGDVVRIASGWPVSPRIRHVVASIVAPFGAPAEERAPVLTEQQRLEIKIKDRLLKDVRSASRGRHTSLERLAQAKKQGYTIPSLDEAMVNVRLAEEEERLKLEAGGKGSKEAHEGRAGQIATEKQRRVERRIKSKEEKQAEQSVSDARSQTV